MAKTKKNPPEDFRMEDLSKEEKLKYEVAMELGLYDKVCENGWKSLTSRETGRIGGIVSKRKKLKNRKNN